MVGQQAGGTQGPVSRPTEPGCRDRRPPPDLKLPRLGGETPEGRRGLHRSSDSAGGAERRVQTTVICVLKTEDERRPSYLCPLLVQAFPQVTDALVHHGHLGVPLVQQLLVLGQLAALLQIVTVTSLKQVKSF